MTTYDAEEGKKNEASFIMGARLTGMRVGDDGPFFVFLEILELLFLALKQGCVVDAGTWTVHAANKCKESFLCNPK